MDHTNFSHQHPKPYNKTFRATFLIPVLAVTLALAFHGDWPHWVHPEVNTVGWFALACLSGALLDWSPRTAKILALGGISVAVNTGDPTVSIVAAALFVSQWVAIKAPTIAMFMCGAAVAVSGVDFMSNGFLIDLGIVYGGVRMFLVADLYHRAYLRMGRGSHGR